MIAVELNNLNDIIKGLQQDLKKAEEDKEYNANLCNTKDKSIDLLKQWLSRSESREAQLLKLCYNYKDELKELKDIKDKIINA